MTLWSVPRDEAMAALGAMKAVAMANGDFADQEREVLRTVANALGHDVDVDALAIAKPEEVVLAIKDELHRKRLVQALIVVALCDESAAPEEVTVVRDYAAALGIDLTWVKTLQHLAEGHMMRLRLDVVRNSFVAEELARVWNEKGFKGLARFFGPIFGKSLDGELAWRFKHLGLLPNGTLGREFWAHMTKNKFTFPGEPGGLPEFTARHDMVHVLTGYLTDPIGELQVGAFSAAMGGENGKFVKDPFLFVFGGMLVFHVGAKVRPLFPAERGQWKPEPILEAMARGARCNRDLMSDWDFWADVEQPIPVLRERFGIG